MMSVKQVSAQLGISCSLVYSWVAAGLLACYRLGRGRGVIRVAQADLELFLVKQKKGGQEQRPATKPEPRVFKHVIIPK